MLEMVLIDQKPRALGRGHQGMTLSPAKKRVYGPIENSNGAFEVMVESEKGPELTRVFISREKAVEWMDSFPDGDSRDKGEQRERQTR